MPASPDHLQLSLMIRGFQVSRMLRLVGDLAIADGLSADGECSVSDLAAASSVHATPLLRVLRTLSSVGVFRVDATGRVSHTPMSLLLRRDAENSLHPAAVALGAPGSWAAWNELDAALIGDVPYQRAWNTSRFEYLRDHPVEGRDFDRLMAQDPGNRHEAVATTYDFSGAASIVDIGGGSGALLHKILARNPDARGIVFDRADVVAAIAPDLLEAGRFAAVSGDFFEGVPAGADLYLLVRVLHDWPDDDCIRILRICRSAMRADSRLLVVEQILEPDPAKGRPLDYLGDMQMMAMFGSARERTRAEFDALLEGAGFASTRVISTVSSASIVEAEPRATTAFGA